MNKMIVQQYYEEAVTGLNQAILEDKDLWYDYVTCLPFNLQFTYTIAILNQQVYNGGLHQYFFNGYGQFAYLTIQHLQHITANESASILRKAVNKVNSENLSIDNFRTKIFNREYDKIMDFDEDLMNYLNELDKEYDNSGEDMEQLIIEFFKHED